MTAAERAELERGARAATSTQAYELRGRIVLACARPGAFHTHVAAELGISPPTVAKWRKRFSFDGAGPAEPVEAGGDRVLVAAQTSDERVQAGQVVAEHTSNPGFELSATAVHHDLGEVTDMLTQGFQSGTPEGARPGGRAP